MKDEGIADKDKVPTYEKELRNFHLTFRDELKEMIDSIPEKAPASILDLGCGDGFYTELLHERFPKAKITGIDPNRALLGMAKQIGLNPQLIQFVEGKLEELAHLNSQFDLVWCAQSLFSLPDEKKAIRQMRDVLKPKGSLAILENDSVHQLLLPWPAEMELSIRRAEFLTHEAETGRTQRFYVARRLPQLFNEVGLKNIQFRTQAIDRMAPLDPKLSSFLASYLEKLALSARKHLKAEEFRKIEPVLNSSHDLYLEKQPLFTLSWVNVLCYGTL